MTSSRRTVGERIRRLFDIRNSYDGEASAEKRALLRDLADCAVKSTDDLQRLHAALCFIRAFPDSRSLYRLACAQLACFDSRVATLSRSNHEALWDTGIAGTRLHYPFSFHVALWLARSAPAAVSIDWEELENVERLDELLELALHGSEDEYFNSGWVTGCEWLELARGQSTDFDWVLAQMRSKKLAKTWSQAYDAANLPLAWDLGRSACSKTHNRFPVASVTARPTGMRRPPTSASREILRPLQSVDRLSARAGRRMIDVAMASLAVRHRETYHFNHANPQDVHVADVGDGVSVAVFGLLPEYRFPLECTMGFLILSNGAPVGYGGSSILFRQINTGINVFDEYRGSEAAFLWVQVMRVYHQLTGCTRYIANPYQFGADNDEALQSGAFWFYHRLGYRPVDAAVRRLANSEWRRVRSDKKYRSNIRTLRRLASCDMHFTLAGARASDLFDERWIETSSLLATRELANVDGVSRDVSARALAKKVARDVGLRKTQRWTPDVRRGIELIAPFIAAAEPSTWPKDARQSMQKILEAKGGPCELDFARRMCGHDHFLQVLRKRCRQAER